VLFELLPHPATPKAAAAPALAPTPARNLRRETPLSMKVLKLATMFSPYNCLPDIPLPAELSASLSVAVRARWIVWI
jgi:hypothetical protein